MKNIRIFYLKNCHFLVVKFSVYLNRRVFVMTRNVQQSREKFLSIKNNNKLSVMEKRAGIAYVNSKGSPKLVLFSHESSRTRLTKAVGQGSQNSRTRGNVVLIRGRACALKD